MLYRSQIFTQASGSIGGLTFSHNRGGPYVRGRGLPTNPGTPEQVAVRNAVAVIVDAWLTVLTEAQREAWGEFAGNVGLPGPLGDFRFVSAQQQYVRSNVPRIQAGLARVDDAPILFDLGQPPTITIQGDASAETLAVAWLADQQWAEEDDAHLLVYSSRPQNPTINFFKGPYRYAGKIAGDETTPPTSPQTLTSPFVLGTGQRVFLQARVTRGDGRLSGTFRNFGTVVA